MEPITVSQIASVLGSGIDSQMQVTSICTDSREAVAGSLFVAIPGERVDGHNYVRRALEQGAALALVEHTGDYPEDKTIMVENTVVAMLHLAAWYRRSFAPHVVGITGSVGKTTTKDMIAAVLSAKFNTIKTIGNQNNEIGAPRTLFSMGRDTEAAVIEMGMSGFGEIKALAEAAMPEIGVITNVGINHLEYLGTRENILKAKLELADALPDGAVLLLCADNDLLEKVEIPRLSVIYYGLENPKAALCGKITGGDSSHTDFVIHWKGDSLPASIPGTGSHLVQNALAAFGVGVSLGMKPEEAIAALGDYQPSGMRQKVVEVSGITVVEDCYNASPDSMAAAMRTLGAFKCTGRRFAVLSDMLELGSMAEQGHRNSGLLAAQQGVDRLMVWGNFANTYAEGARAGGLATTVFDCKENIATALAVELRVGDVVWFKASRGQKLEEVLEELYSLLKK